MSTSSFMERLKALDTAQADARARAREEERAGSYKNRYIQLCRENRTLREKLAALESEQQDPLDGEQLPAGTEPEPETTEGLLEQLDEELDGTVE